MRIKNNHKRFTLLLIFMLFIFQNAWAVEQTYLMICQTTQSNQIDSHVDNDDSVEHDHKQCADCCHLNTSLVTIMQLNNFNYSLAGNRYQLIVFEQFYSVYLQPPLPPPIV